MTDFFINCYDSFVYIILPQIGFLFISILLSASIPPNIMPSLLLNSIISTMNYDNCYLQVTLNRPYLNLFNACIFFIVS
jgi:hypothetical protein